MDELAETRYSRITANRGSTMTTESIFSPIKEIRFTGALFTGTPTPTHISLASIRLQESNISLPDHLANVVTTPTRSIPLARDSLASDQEMRGPRVFSSQKS